MKIELFADKVSVRGPRIDGGYTVSFDFGEQEQVHVAQLIAVPQQTVVKVTVEVPEHAIS